MRESGRESMRKLKPMRFKEHQKKLLRADVRRECKASSNPLYQLAAELASLGYGWEDVQKRAGVTSELARALVLGE